MESKPPVPGEDVARGARVLADRHKLMRSFLDAYGVPRLYRGSFDPGRVRMNLDQDPFGFLVETVVYQQLSGTSARAIFARLVEETGLDPERILAAGLDRLRQLGLSSSKCQTVINLASSVLCARLDLARIAGEPDAVVRAAVVSQRGFGPWSADMFLMFHLRRLDVWPAGDLAMRRSVERHWAGGEKLKGYRLDEIGEEYRPYRSLAAWYFWADDHARLLASS